LFRPGSVVRLGYCRGKVLEHFPRRFLLADLETLLHRGHGIAGGDFGQLLF